jgi:hypothetical protein
MALENKGFDLQKQILMLSVAVAATFSAPVMAQTVPDPILDITTALTQPIQTATAVNGGPGDIVLDTGGSLTVTSGAAAVTINSDNSFEQVTDTTITYKNADAAVGVLVDLTTHDINATNLAGCTAGTDCAHVSEGIVMSGDLDLSGTGGTKRGLWLEGPDPDGTAPGPFTYTGNIDLSQSTFTVSGDNSVGVLIDQNVNYNGNITFGTLNMQTTSLTGSSSGLVGFENNGVINGDVRVGFVDNANDIDDVSAFTVKGSTSLTNGSGVTALELAGTINGNVVVDTGSSVIASGTGAQGIILTGVINACNQATSPGCSSLGSLINRGNIETVGTVAALTSLTGNPTPSFALGIGGSVLHGILNDGAAQPDDLIAGATISGEGAAPVIEISPGLQSSLTPVPVVIGIYTDDHIDPGFSFYNRGSILAQSSNYNQDTTAFTIIGDGPDAIANLQGGLLNSGTISATVNTTSAATGPASATAINVGANAYFGPNDIYKYGLNGCDCMQYAGSFSLGAKIDGERAALVNTDSVGNGTILATATGPTSGNSAFAINIDDGATLPSIINSGTIEAVSVSSDTTISNLAAVAIQDSSGTLTYIQNNGNIEAITSELDDETQQSIAINLAGDDVKGAASNGVEILNQATAGKSALIIGDIDFGTGDHQIVDVEGLDSGDTATISGDIKYGAGGAVGSDELNIGNYATVVGAITSDPDVGVKVDVANNGILTITNDTQALYAAGFHVEGGGTLNLQVFEDFNTGIVDASKFNGAQIALDSGAKLNITYGSFVPADSTFVLFTAQGNTENDNNISVPDINIYDQQLLTEKPFLFDTVALQIQDNPDLVTESLVLKVTTKTAQQLGLTGYAGQMLPFVNQALVNDNPLGAAIVAGITDQKSAQNAYDQFAPDVTGGARAIAMSLTDQATGPVAARQRMLRMYGKDSGDATLWGQEFAEFIKDPGDTSTGKTGYKDHGFGFVLGLDGGEPKTGWYGGALSFYSGDIVEALPRDSHTNSLWYTLTGYTDWRGKGLFLDTKVDVGYMTLDQKRFLNLTIPPTTTGGSSTSFIDEADSRRPGLVGSAGFTTGVILAYGATTLTPQLSVDAMTLREEGYSESHPTGAPGNGKGFDLTASSYYANSARIFVGADIRHDLDFGDFFVQPDVRAGYRYDFLNDPTKVTARFSNISPNATGVMPGPDFTIEGPDPSQGNFVAGASLSATTDAWTVGLNFDYVRGTNGAVTEVGTVHLLGRI